MARETLLNQLAAGTISEEEQVVLFQHHPHNRRNNPGKVKPHNTTGHLEDELLTPKGDLQIMMTASYIAQIAVTGCLPPEHPLPEGMTDRRILPVRANQVLMHAPPTLRCFSAALRISWELSKILRNVDWEIVIGKCDLESVDPRLRGPDMGKMNGMTDLEIMSEFPEHYNAYKEWVEWQEANQYPLSQDEKSPHPFPPDYPEGDEVLQWLVRFGHGLEDALKLRTSSRVEPGVIVHVIELTTSGSRAAEEYMRAARTGNTNNDGELASLGVHQSTPGDISVWKVGPGGPPEPRTKGYIRIPGMPEFLEN